MVEAITNALAVVGFVAVSCFLSMTAQAQQVPGEQRYDVIVYGGTAGGVTAAVAAARQDVRVLLLEPGEHLGGMVSGGLGATDVGNENVIGGTAREFFERMGAHYGLPGATWRHEPHVAEQTFVQMAREAGVTVRFKQRIREQQGVAVRNGRIQSLTTEAGDVFAADVFIDATYEGDLMAQAGVSYTVGRESTGQYGEERAGVRPLIPMRKPGIAYDGQGMLPDVAEPSGPVGSADKRIMSYTFRLCMTRDPANRVPFNTRPDGYDARRYVLLLQNFADKPDMTLGQIINLAEVPNGKTDTNNKPGVNISTNLHNGSWEYPEASYQRRAEIWQEHERYVRGLLYFLTTDERVPQAVRDEANEWGLARDEFADNNNWPHQLYVRVGRRMLGEHVMTALDLTEALDKPDSIGLGSYFMDSHRVARVVIPNGDVATEGGVGGRTLPYEISYRSITPRREECRNLLVPVCMSSSGVAWCSIRMEPQFMVMGHSAGVAAAIAVQDGVDVQAVPYEKLEAILLAQGQVLDRALPPPDHMKGVVVDDVEAESRGNWVSATSATGFIGPHYLHDGNKNKGQSTLRFVPELPSDGLYAVRLFFTPHANRASNVPVSVQASDGVFDYQVDQRTLPEGERSYLVGTHRFEAGKGGAVTLSNTGTDGFVTIDAVQFIPVAAPSRRAAAVPPPDDAKRVIVDDVDSEFRGTWVPATSAPKFIGPRYLHDGNKDKGQSTLRFVPEMSADGLYAVRLHFTPHPNRASNVPVTVRAADGVFHYELDQRTLPEAETSRYVGTHRFEAGKSGSVTLSNTGTSGYVTIDAVEFIPVAVPLPDGLPQLNAPPPGHEQERGWSVRLIGMKGQPQDMGSVDNFFPAFDEFGQYVHRDWPGKVHSELQLKQQYEREQTQLVDDSGPRNWSRFGGYADGPRLEATGFFRTQKHGGRWWLVDPEGYLFFSHGVNCVRKMDPTPIERREDWFGGEPWTQPDMKPFVLSDVRAVKYDYAGTTPLSFNFTWANLLRKYGPDWDATSGEVAHRRLRFWGFNTIGNWSHEPTYLMRRTPYTVNLGFSGPRLVGSPRAFRDPYDPAYAQAVVDRLRAEEGKSLNDPWCIGYFVDNELPWGSEHSLGLWTLQSPREQPAKIAMVDDLKTKYRTIDALNKAWATDYLSWENLLASTTAPDSPAAIEDQKAFHRQFARTYFKTTRDAIRSVTPNPLYLGCRFHTRNQAAREAAAEFCDVISYNTYADTPDTTLDDFDVPMMITEYSFGATDVGLFYGGGNEVETQADRVAGYETFITHALNNPSVVGAHWFQYSDQPASGRTLEGENGQYGLVDIVDTPYAQLTAATRRFADRVYEQLSK